MTEREAEESLAGLPMVTVLEGTLAYIKELHAKCLAEDIAAIMQRPCHGKSS